MPLLDRSKVLAPATGGPRFHLAKNAPRPPRHSFRTHPGYGGKGEALAKAQQACGHLCDCEAVRRGDGKFIPVVWLRPDQTWLDPWVGERGAVVLQMDTPLDD